MQLRKVSDPFIPIMKYPTANTSPVGNIELFWSHTRASSLGLIFLVFVPMEVPFFLSPLVQLFSVKWIQKRTKIVMKLEKVFGTILPIMKYPPATTGPVGNIELFWSRRAGIVPRLDLFSVCSNGSPFFSSPL